MKEQTNSSQPYSSLFASVSEAANTVVKLAQNNVISRIETGVSNIVRTIALVLVAAIFGAVGALFVLVGAAIWLGSATGYGTWFGLLAVGAVALLIAFIANLKRQAKK